MTNSNVTTITTEAITTPTTTTIPTVTASDILNDLFAASRAQSNNSANMVLLAIQSDDLEAFLVVIDAAFEAYRDGTDKRSLKESNKCIANAKGKFLIPQTMSNAKSNIKRGMEYGLDLGSEASPNTLNSIKQLVLAANKAKSDAAKAALLTNEKTARVAALKERKDSKALQGIAECKAMMLYLAGLVDGLEAEGQPAPMAIIQEVHAQLFLAVDVKIETIVKRAKSV